MSIRSHSRTLWIGAILSPGSYFLFLFAAGSVNVSSISPVREDGIGFGALFGLLILKEPQGVRRITASAAVAASIVLVALSSR
ncbi:hypothetical protein [Cohnella zeiphila]|uniref:EamA domain-containing protein n=1 Tax=Cohnella zeiphila TaxID=2761120 RepID=A0A7X0ST15_9BACL|nr:hypothetical protein [Cohnella zeiphila]MBB6734355.1 hypothetical protein [Cohnella zeiphila]